MMHDATCSRGARPAAAGRAAAPCARATKAAVMAALASVLAVALGAWAPAVAAAGPNAAFTVGNYPVEASGKDALTAKRTAQADGQQAALRSLLRRLVPVTALRRLKQLPPLKSADYFDGLAVRTERSSPTQYIATLDFSFQPAAIRDLLRRASIPFVDTQAPPVVLVPLYRESAGATYEASAFWSEAWKGLDLDHALSPMKVEAAKPELTSDLIAAIVKSKGNTDKLATAYGSPRVLLALAEPDPTGKKLTVTIAGTDAVGPFALQRNYRISGGDRAYTAELAAVVGLGVLEGRWKAAKAGAAGGVEAGGGPGGDTIQLVVEFGSLNEWNDLRARLLEADGAFDLSIDAVSARSAEVSVRHAGGPEGMARSLAARGLTMQSNGGTWLVRPTF